MGGVSFGRREVDEAESDARANAWQKAIAKGEQLADHAGHITTVTVTLTVRFALLG